MGFLFTTVSFQHLVIGHGITMGTFWINSSTNSPKSSLHITPQNPERKSYSTKARSFCCLDEDIAIGSGRSPQAIAAPSLKVSTTCVAKGPKDSEAKELHKPFRHFSSSFGTPFLPAFEAGCRDDRNEVVLKSCGFLEIIEDAWFAIGAFKVSSVGQ